MRTLTFLLACFALQACTPFVLADSPDFERDVAPLLVQHCLDCHQINKRSGELDLTTLDGVLRGGESGAAIVPGKPTESILLERVTAGEMPPPETKGARKLTSDEIERLRKWIAAGATWPKDRELGLHEKTVDLDEARKFWSFRKVERPPVPEIGPTHRAANPIDAFIGQKLAASGLTLSDVAEPRDLLRRASLDVRGLPPSLEEQRRYLNDASPEAYAHLIDRLLADPAYGERWARHWLDLVRYADSNGYERDAAKPSVYQYRDYVIRSLNADKPYDKFVIEQLAGDELSTANLDTLAAVGFHALGTWQDEVDPLEAPQYRADELDDMIRTTSQTFLGITLGCARCHQHKFDPFTMVDYYSLSAILAPMKRPAAGRDDRDLPAGTPEQLRSGGKDLPRTYRLIEDSPAAPPTFLLKSGRAGNPGPAMQPRVPAVLTSVQPIFPTAGKHSTLRRLTFAEWTASRDNPLTARVMVNRVWQHHFGTGLVATSSDFGQLGARPSHPELLDWLSHWFMHDANWSLKELHRLILTSETYRQSSQWNEAAAKVDPENKLLWRYPYHRLDVEAIRDATLAVSGGLNRKAFGPAVYLPLPEAVIEAHTDKKDAWKSSPPHETDRRTIYAFVKRTLMVPMFETFDFCDTTLSTERRSITCVAPQALTLYNGTFVNREAERFAVRLVSEAGDDPAKQIDLAYRLALTRSPSDEESNALKAFLDREAANVQKEASLDGAKSRRRALIQMCRAILNLNEFVYPN